MKQRNYFPLIMKGLALVFSVVTLVCFFLNDYDTAGPLGTCAITGLTFSFHLLMRLAVGTWIPNCFHRSSAWFHVHPWEEKLYRRLKIKQWKSRVPTYDPKSFSLEENSLEQILSNMRHAEVVHEVIVVFSFLPLLFSLVFGEFVVFLITSVIAAAVDLVFVALQRSNRPRLERLLKRQQKSANSPLL